MAIATASPDEVIESALWNSLAALVNGTSGGSDPVKFIQHSSTTVYSLTVGNQDTTNGLAAKFQFGDPAGAPTTIATIAKAGSSFYSASNSTFALVAQGTHATDGSGLQVLAQNGTTNLLRVGENSSNGFVSVNLVNTTEPSSNTFLVAKTATASWVMADFGLTITAGSTDSASVRATIATATAGTIGLRAFEGHTLRQTGATGTSPWVAELGLHSEIAGNGTTQNVGIYLSSHHTGWTSTGTRNDSALLILGEDGWTHGIRYLDTDNSTVLFNVTQAGAVTAGTQTSRANVTYDLGSSGNYWRNTFSQTFLVLDGSAASPSICFGNDTDNGFYLAAANQVGVSTGGSVRGVFSSSGLTITPASGSAAVVKVGQQYGFASGSTSSPTTTSASYADLAEMSVTLTTTGGDLKARFVGAFAHSDATKAGVIALSLDAAAEVFAFAISVPIANEAFMIVTQGRFTGVSAGSHTVKVRWLTDGATLTSNGVDRFLDVEEVGH